MADQQLLLQTFQQADTDRSGAINPAELQAALMSGSRRPFSYETCRLMIKMFDKEGYGKISFEDFGALWKSINDWQNCFTMIDKDSSGSISNQELLAGLQSFGFKLPLKTVDTIIKRFDRGSTGIIYFNNFIHTCVTLQNITSGFRKFDLNNKEEIKIKYEDFVELVFRAGL